MAQGRKGRETAVQVLYQVEDAHGVLPADPSTGLNNFFQNFEHDEEAREDARDLVEGVCRNQTTLDALLEKHSHRWKVSRMAKVDRNVLRLAAHEIKERPHLPVRVLINEAVELGKKFGSETSSAFINGVLDPVAKELRPL